LFAAAMAFCAICLIFLTLTAVKAKVTQSRPQTFQADVGIKDGSVIFWKDGALVKPISKHTGSDITHAAVVLGGYVYEAVPPCVRKVTLEEYVKEMNAKAKKPAMQRRGFTWTVVQPKKSYTTAEVSEMREYAEAQLGRPYMLRGWWKGHEVRGIFCSQYVSNTLERGGRIKSSSFRESPGSLFNKIKDLYQ
jgi:hypothetical protein